MKNDLIATKNNLIIGKDWSHQIIYREDQLETLTLDQWDNLPSKLAHT